MWHRLGEPINGSANRVPPLACFEAAKRRSAERRAHHESAAPYREGMDSGRDLLWTSKRIDAAETHRIWLVDYACDPDALLGRAGAYLAEGERHAYSRRRHQAARLQPHGSGLPGSVSRS